MLEKYVKVIILIFGVIGIIGFLFKLNDKLNNVSTKIIYTSSLIIVLTKVFYLILK